VRRTARWWRTVAAAALAGLVVAGCDEGGDDDGDDGSPPAQPADEEYDLTGIWRFQGRESLYKLTQRGRSVQGVFVEPSDPTVRGDIAGVVNGDEVVLYVAVTFDTHPEDNFTARKEGVIHSRNHMTLVVTGGPRYVGQVQQWYRQ